VPGRKSILAAIGPPGRFTGGRTRSWGRRKRRVGVIPTEGCIKDYVSSRVVAGSTGRGTSGSSGPGSRMSAGCGKGA